MKLTLRKARKVEQQIGTAFKAIKLKPAVSVSMFEQDVKKAYGDGIASAISDLEKMTWLSATRRAIRDSIAHANFESGINALISERKETKDVADKMGALASAIETYAPVDVAIYHAAKVEKDASEETGGRYRFEQSKTENVSVPMYTKETAEGVSSDLKGVTKKLNDIDDKLFELNATNHVDVDESVLSRLEGYGII